MKLKIYEANEINIAWIRKARGKTSIYPLLKMTDFKTPQYCKHFADKNANFVVKKVELMPRSYSGFKIQDLSALGILVERNLIFNGNIPPVEPSDYLKKTIEKNVTKNLATEKAKSEFLIAPIVAEIEERNADVVSFYSGYQFDVDKTLGLKGFCDFVLSFSPRSLIITEPVFCIAEAKNDNLDTGIPQCIAEMYAASIFNDRKKRPISTIFGAVTFGFQWQFIRFQNMKAEVDKTIYGLESLPKILGILQHIVDLQKQPFSIP